MIIFKTQILLLLFWTAYLKLENQVLSESAVIPGTFSVPCPKCQFYQIKSDFNQAFETACRTHCLICIGMAEDNGEKAALKMLFQLITGTR